MPRHASTRPVLRKSGRNEPAAKLAQPLKMVSVQRPLAPYGKTDTMDRDPETLGQTAKLREGASASTHVVFGIHLQPADRTWIGHDRGKVLRACSRRRPSRAGGWRFAPA